MCRRSSARLLLWWLRGTARYDACLEELLLPPCCSNQSRLMQQQLVAPVSSACMLAAKGPVVTTQVRCSRAVHKAGSSSAVKRARTACWIAGAASTFFCCLCALQIAEMEAVVRHSQSYAQTLQNYNTSLQTDVQVRWHAGLPTQSLQVTWVMQHTTSCICVRSFAKPQAEH